MSDSCSFLDDSGHWGESGYWPGASYRAEGGGQWGERGGGYRAEARRRLVRSRRKKEKDAELDAHRLEQRVKQIAYGENTRGYANLMKALEHNPSLLKGCIPLKPAIDQKCSKRSWDGQVRKWRRALHMYDYVDFGESEEQSAEVRNALVEQTLNPVFTPRADRGALRFDLFSPMRGTTWAEEFDSPFAPSPTPGGNRPHPFYSASPIRYSASPIRVSVTKAEPEPDAAAKAVAAQPKPQRVRYTMEHLMRLAEAPLVAQAIHLPDSLGWLDKQVDLEDDVEDDYDAPSLDLRSPVAHRFLGSPYEHAPTTPRRLSTGTADSSTASGTPGRGWLHWHNDALDERSPMPHDAHPGLLASPTPRPCLRRVSLGSVTSEPPGLTPGLAVGQHRTPLRPILHTPARAATALKRKQVRVNTGDGPDKENQPPSLFCTPPRRACDFGVEDNKSLYSRLAGFL